LRIRKESVQEKEKASDMALPEKLNRGTVKTTIFKLFCAFMICSIFYMYFQTHFYLGTVINGVNFSCKTTKEVEEVLTDLALSYTLELDEQGGVKEQIKGSEIGLKFNAEVGSQSIKKEQNRVNPFVAIFNHRALKIDNALTYDENLLKDRLAKLSCVDGTKVTETKNATLVYAKDGYKIVKEIYGDKADEDILYTSIIDAVLHNKTKLDLEKAKCYPVPTILADSQQVKDTKRMLEKYITAKITYRYAGGRAVVDANEIVQWLELENDLNVIFNNAKMKSFVNALASHYNTYGTVRDFATATGAAIKIGGGDYGWRVDINGEIAYLTEAVKNGETASREPLYSQRGASYSANDIGNTYVEINLAAQHLWYYQNGALLAEGDVTTGNVSSGNGTPTGIYRLKYKDTNAVLRGEDYSVPVAYWMPFNNDIGIHDATWRTEFGGKIYLTSGSHGCINAPYSLAETIFSNISPGTPVVCYEQIIEPKNIPGSDANKRTAPGTAQKLVTEEAEPEVKDLAEAPFLKQDMEAESTGDNKTLI
jgi:hypothetical protein